MSAQYRPEQNLLIAVLGTQNAGKSTILNSLIGAEIFPRAAKTETASIAEVRHDGNLDPGVFVCTSSTGDEAVFGKDPTGRSVSHDEVLEWVRAMNKADGIPQLTVRSNLTTVQHYTSLGLGGVSLFDVPGTNETAEKETRIEVVGGVLARANFICIVLPFSDLGADSVEELAKLVREFASSTCQVSLFVNKMDVVPVDERKDIRKKAEDEVFSPDERERLFGRRPTSLYFARGVDALASVCRGCDLKTCRLPERHFHCICDMDDDDEIAQLKLRKQTKQAIAALKTQTGNVGPFVTPTDPISEEEQEVRRAHDEMATIVRRASGIDGIWREFILDMVQARAVSVTECLSEEKDSEGLDADQGWRRLLKLRGAYRELSFVFQEVSERNDFKDDAGKIWDRSNDLIIKRTREFVGGIVGGNDEGKDDQASSEHGRTKEVERMLTWGLTQLALASESRLAAETRVTIEDRTQGDAAMPAAVLQLYINDIEDVRRTIDDASVTAGLDSAARKTLEELALASESRRAAESRATIDERTEGDAAMPTVTLQQYIDDIRDIRRTIDDASITATMDRAARTTLEQLALACESRRASESRAFIDESTLRAMLKAALQQYINDIEVFRKTIDDASITATLDSAARKTLKQLALASESRRAAETRVSITQGDAAMPAVALQLYISDIEDIRRIIDDASITAGLDSAARKTLEELALASESRRAAKTRITIDERTQEDAAMPTVALQMYIDDIRDIRRTINDASITATLERAARTTLKRLALASEIRRAAESRATIDERTEGDAAMLTAVLQQYINDIEVTRRTINDASITTGLDSAARKTLEELALASERRRAAECCAAIDKRTQGDAAKLAHALQKYINDIEDIRRTIVNASITDDASIVKLRIAAQATLEQAVTQQHVERFSGLWEQSTPPKFAKRRMTFSDLEGDIKKKVLDGGFVRGGEEEEKKVIQECVKMAGEVQESVFDKVPSLKEFPDASCLRVVEFAPLFEATKEALNALNGITAGINLEVPSIMPKFISWWDDFSQVNGQRRSQLTSWLLDRIPTIIASTERVQQIIREETDRHQSSRKWRSRATALGIGCGVALASAGALPLVGAVVIESMVGFSGLCAAAGTSLSLADGQQKYAKMCEVVKTVLTANLPRHLAICKSAISFVKGQTTAMGFLQSINPRQEGRAGHSFSALIAGLGDFRRVAQLANAGLDDLRELNASNLAMRWRPPQSAAPSPPSSRSSSTSIEHRS